MSKRAHEPTHKAGKKTWDTGEPTGEKPFTNRVKLEKATKKFLTLLIIELMCSPYDGELE